MKHSLLGNIYPLKFQSAEDKFKAGIFAPRPSPSEHLMVHDRKKTPSECGIRYRISVVYSYPFCQRQGRFYYFTSPDFN